MPDLNNNYDQLLDYFSGVEEGKFSHYEYAGSQGNLKVFALYYIVKFPETSKFGREGEVRITIVDDGNEYGHCLHRTSSENAIGDFRTTESKATSGSCAVANPKRFIRSVRRLINMNY